MARHSIYLLVNTWTHQPIYCGQTVKKLPARLANARHEWKYNKDGHRKHLAITGVYAMGGKLAIIEIDHASSQEEADRLEIEYIDKMKKRGYCWGNTSAGGAGNHGVKRSRADRKRISRSVKAYHRKRNFIHNLFFSSPIFIPPTAKPNK